MTHTHYFFNIKGKLLSISKSKLPIGGFQQIARIHKFDADGARINISELAPLAFARMPRAHSEQHELNYCTIEADEQMCGDSATPVAKINTELAASKLQAV